MFDFVSWSLWQNATTGGDSRAHRRVVQGTRRLRRCNLQARREAEPEILESVDGRRVCDADERQFRLAATRGDGA